MVRRVCVCFWGLTAYQRGLLAGVRRFARERGDWQLRVESTLGLRPEHARDGVLDGVIGELYEPAVVDELVARRLPTVALFGSDRPGVVALRVDDEAVGRLAARHLVEQGFGRFAAIGQGEAATNGRVVGFAAELAAAGHGGVPVRGLESETLVTRPLDFEAGVDDETATWLATLPSGTGLLATSDRLAFNVASACEGLGLSIPGRLGVVGVDDDEVYCETSTPSISSVEVPWELMGYRAASLLQGWFDDGRPPAGDPVPVRPTRVVGRVSSQTLAVADREVARAVRFIDENCHRPIGVEDLVRVTGLPRRTLQRRFAAATDASILDHLRRVRVRRVRQLLERTDLPLGEVARRTGFANANWMASVFRDEAGVAPGAYRERHHAEGEEEEASGARRRASDVPDA